MNTKLTLSRSPIDNALSGALAGAIAGAASEIANVKKGKNKKQAMYDGLNSALRGGIIAGGAIYSANKLVQGEYLGALVGAVLATCALEMSENLITKEEK
ncbi:Cys/Met metabolism pyridoxal-phosphate-dependent enzyme [Campylobacter sp. VBCF_06 NA8]|uniref:Cys/Met metabolism pyridoxal-phosphate-dependent enzyme n=1 Tax=unclassified Campylobacter TaxID=2593542 RepID=UPI0022E9EDDD|nr:MULTISPECIES: Cys/Met metabolism pyridoxal-phosphate-dependent enzyme [unclassified Campylobacter]MDA3047068.1 Cys/Met metabolism pyridoxal-phosphate-dependent enzyme [Campylobacter sp. VBCF_06 NA8]MDA3076848.1 Cys/Met metabolism pyridoxal-phosphate-dependent enzyme [Campylobacter sp. JMF_04 NA10]